MLILTTRQLSYSNGVYFYSFYVGNSNSTVEVSDTLNVLRDCEIFLQGIKQAAKVKFWMDYGCQFQCGHLSAEMAEMKNQCDFILIKLFVLGPDPSFFLHKESENPFSYIFFMSFRMADKCISDKSEPGLSSDVDGYCHSSITTPKKKRKGKLTEARSDSNDNLSCYSSDVKQLRSL